jgi:hypothetical protein
LGISLQVELASLPGYACEVYFSCSFHVCMVITYDQLHAMQINLSRNARQWASASLRDTEISPLAIKMAAPHTLPACLTFS